MTKKQRTRRKRRKQQRKQKEQEKIIKSLMCPKNSLDKRNKM